MSQDAMPINPHDIPPAKPGMTTAGKVLLGLGIGCGIFVLLCCGVTGVFMFMGVRMAQQAQVTDPQELRDLTADIVTINIPGRLQPQMGINLKLPIVGTPMVMGAIYADGTLTEHGEGEDHAEHNVIVIGQLGDQFADNPDMRKQLDELSRSGGHDDDFEATETDKFATTINGDPVEFKIDKGHGHEESDERWHVVQPFIGKGGPALIVLHLKTADFTKEQVLEILQSMK